MTLPNMIKVDNLAPVVPDAKLVHQMACAYVEEQFALKGKVLPTWLVAAGSKLAFIEMEFEDDYRSKELAVYVIRGVLERYNSQAYSFISEAWTAAFKSDAERKKWMSHPDYEGVASLPPSMRDDIAMIISHDRKGGCLMSKYLVTERHGKGPNFLGPRMDDEQYVGMRGRMSNLFEPEVPLDFNKKETGE